MQASMNGSLQPSDVPKYLQLETLPFKNGNAVLSNIANGRHKENMNFGKLEDKVSGPAINLYTPSEIFIKPSEKFDADMDYYRGRPMPDYGGFGFYDLTKMPQPLDTNLRGEDNKAKAEIARIGVDSISNQVLLLGAGAFLLFILLNGGAKL